MEDLLLETTINNVQLFPYSKINHAFGTVIIPVKMDGKVLKKQYLIDVSYRQFFSSIRCHKGMFYCSDSQNQILAAPDPGYFMCLSDRGRAIARTLLKKGYIELTPEVLKKYVESFMYASIGLDQLELYDKISKLEIDDCYEYIFQRQEEHDYDRKEFESWGCTVRIPYLKYEENQKGVKR